MKSPTNSTPKSRWFKFRYGPSIAGLALLFSILFVAKFLNAQNAAEPSQESPLAKPGLTPGERAVQRALARDEILNPRTYQIVPSAAEVAAAQAMVNAISAAKQKPKFRTPEEVAAAAAILNPQQPLVPAANSGVPTILNPETDSTAKRSIATRFAFEKDESEIVKVQTVEDPLVFPHSTDRSKARPSVPRRH